MATKMRDVVVLLQLLAVLTAASGSGSSSSSSKDRCHSGDKAALLAISAALGNPYHFASWTPDTPCCDWYDVDCDASTGRVVGLSVFQDANITGAIPDAVAGLVHLQNLVLHHLPGISGPIPPAIAKLSNLTFLTISWTAVSGPVPSFLGALTKLAQLDLSFNSLSGAVPPSLAALPALYSVDISRNRLTGALPPLLFSKVNKHLQPPQQQACYLRLSHNNLTGAVPPEFSAVAFAQLDLSRNAFAGDASGLFGGAKANNKELQYLDLSRNAFAFNLSGVELPEQLDFLDLSHNAIYGGIPAQVATLGNLQFFNVSYNRLCGAVPTGGNMGRFDAYSYQHNKCLCGAPLADPCKYKATSTSRTSCSPASPAPSRRPSPSSPTSPSSPSPGLPSRSHTSPSSTSPSTPSLAPLPALYSIDISRNRLTGALPPLLFSKLKHLQPPSWPTSGYCTTTFPPEFSDVAFAQELQYLDLSHNAFGFNLSGVEMPEQLDFLNVSHNAIYGGIPAQVATLINLQFFNVIYNRLCGAVCPPAATWTVPIRHLQLPAQQVPVRSAACRSCKPCAQRSISIII
ncbi:LOW QUALITY PROTEIN: hypothetical protein U9M48_041414 [Paspalum notatum var. saurae]|uniref:Leucine-rich repeat-containing N-terminal plant-type domain-containing protein n=1 Tax=Paspalum notatum var. saurae TaxID=547442 RepID=A0AAQ3XEU1_PASNO